MTRLVQRVRQLAEQSPFYKRLLKRAVQGLQVEPASQDLAQVPVTTKEDLRRGFPRSFLVSPWEDIAAYFESSGTTNGSINSSRTMSLKTRKDLARDAERRLPAHLNAGRGQVAVVNLPYAVTSSAHGFHRALESAGCVVVAVDQGQQLASFTRVGDLLMSLEARILVTADPFLLRDIYLYDTGTDIFELPNLEYILTVGVPLSRAAREEVRSRYGKKIMPYYGMSEFGAVGVPDDQGRMYVHEDFFLELRSPEGMVNAGELILWDLQSEGAPLIRYQTGDVGRVEYITQADGQTRCVLEVVGRMKEAIFDGTTYLFPVYFQELLVGIPGISPIHRVSVEGEERPSITLDLQVTEPRLAASAVAEVQRRAAALTVLPVTIQTHPWGKLFDSTYSQQQFRNVQTAKTMSFHDKRKGEFLVTY